MGASQKSAAMDRSAVIRTIDWERLRKVPDLHPFEKAHHSKQTVQIPLFAIASPPPPPLAVAAKAAPAACGKNRGKSTVRQYSGGTEPAGTLYAHGLRLSDHPAFESRTASDMYMEHVHWLIGIEVFGKSDSWPMAPFRFSFAHSMLHSCPTPPSRGRRKRCILVLP